MAAASGKHKDTYRATAVFLVLTGLLYLIDKWVGLILLGIWLIQNIGLVISLLGQMSTFLLPATLLVIGVLLYFLSSRG